MAAAKRRTGAAELFDGENDPSPDVFKVVWKDDEHVKVTHYRDRETRKSCCFIEGRITDADKASEHGAQIACLQRLQMPCGYR